MFNIVCHYVDGTNPAQTGDLGMFTGQSNAPAVTLAAIKIMATTFRGRHPKKDPRRLYFMFDPENSGPHMADVGITMGPWHLCYASHRRRDIRARTGEAGLPAFFLDTFEELRVPADIPLDRLKVVFVSGSYRLQKH